MPEGDREWGSAQCSSLEHLEDFVRQFIGHAPTHMFVQTLLVLEAADARAAARAGNAGGSSRTFADCCAQLQVNLWGHRAAILWA